MPIAVPKTRVLIPSVFEASRGNSACSVLWKELQLPWQVVEHHHGAISVLAKPMHAHHKIAFKSAPTKSPTASSHMISLANLDLARIVGPNITSTQGTAVKSTARPPNKLAAP
jgi:hypothetical protein